MQIKKQEMVVGDDGIERGGMGCMQEVYEAVGWKGM